MNRDGWFEQIRSSGTSKAMLGVVPLVDLSGGEVISEWLIFPGGSCKSLRIRRINLW